MPDNYLDKFKATAPIVSGLLALVGVIAGFATGAGAVGMAVGAAVAAIGGVVASVVFSGNPSGLVNDLMTWVGQQFGIVKPDDAPDNRWFISKTLNPNGNKATASFTEQLTQDAVNNGLDYGPGAAAYVGITAADMAKRKGFLGKAWSAIRSPYTVTKAVIWDIPKALTVGTLKISGSVVRGALHPFETASNAYRGTVNMITAPAKARALFTETNEILKSYQQTGEMTPKQAATLEEFQRNPRAKELMEKAKGEKTLFRGKPKNPHLDSDILNKAVAKSEELLKPQNNAASSKTTGGKVTVEIGADGGVKVTTDGAAEVKIKKPNSVEGVDNPKAQTGADTPDGKPAQPKSKSTPATPSEPPVNVELQNAKSAEFHGPDRPSPGATAPEAPTKVAPTEAPGKVTTPEAPKTGKATSATPKANGTHTPAPKGGSGGRLSRLKGAGGMTVKGGLGIASGLGLYYGGKHFKESYRTGDVEGMATSGTVVAASGMEIGSLALGSRLFNGAAMATKAAKFLGPAGIIAGGAVSWYENGKWLGKNHPWISDKSQFDENVDMRMDMANTRIRQNRPGVIENVFNDIGLPLKPEIGEYKRLAQITRQIKANEYQYTNGQAIDLQEIAHDPKDMRRIVSQLVRGNHKYHSDNESKAYWDLIISDIPLIKYTSVPLASLVSGKDIPQELANRFQSTYEALDFASTGSSALRELNGLGDDGNGNHVIRGYEERMDEYNTKLKPLEEKRDVLKGYVYKGQIAELHKLQDMALAVQRTQDRRSFSDRLYDVFDIPESQNDRTSEQQALADKLDQLSYANDRESYAQFVQQELIKRSAIAELTKVEAMDDDDREDYFKTNTRFIEKLDIGERPDLMAVGLSQTNGEYLLKKMVYMPEKFVQQANEEITRNQSKVEELKGQVAAIRARAANGNIDLDQYLFVVDSEGQLAPSDSGETAHEIFQQEIEWLRNTPSQTAQEKAQSAAQEAGFVTAQIVHLSTELKALNDQFKQHEQTQQAYVSTNGSTVPAADPVNNSHQLKSEIDAMEKQLQTIITEYQAKHGDEALYEKMGLNQEVPDWAVEGNKRIIELEAKSKGYEKLLAGPNGDIMAASALKAKHEALTIQTRLVKKLLGVEDAQSVDPQIDKILWTEAGTVDAMTPSSTPTMPSNGVAVMPAQEGSMKQATTTASLEVANVDGPSVAAPGAPVVVNNISKQAPSHP